MTEDALDTKYADTVSKVTREVLETMVMTPPERIRDDLDQDLATSAEVVAQLGFTGSSHGVYLLSTSMEVARGLCARMLMMEPEELTDNAEIADGFGEICNMVGGGVKNTWVADGGTMELAIPAVMFGDELHVAFSEDDVTGIAIAAVLPEGELRVDMRIHKTT